MSTVSRVIKNTSFLYAKMGITMFISLYTTRLILNALGASDFGIFNIVGGAIALLGFLNAAMAGATQRFMSYGQGKGNKENQKVVFNISFVLHIYIAIILGLSLLIVGYFFFSGVLNIIPERIYAAKVVYGSLIVSTMFTVMTVPYDAVLNAHENMLYYSIVGVIESFLKLVVALIILYARMDKLILYGTLMACIPLLTMSIMRIYCHNRYEECVISPRRYWETKLMREMLRFAGWNFLLSASGMISQYGMGIVLNHFYGTVLNAAQGIANQISGQLMTFSHIVLKALNPIITKSEGNGDREMVIRASFAGSKFSFFLFSIFSVPVIVETGYLLRIWLSNVPDWSVLFCQLQLLRILTEQLTISIGSGVFAQGNIKMFSQVRSYLNIIPIIVTYIFFYYKLPPYFLYIIWIFCWSILGGGVSLYFAHKNIDLSYKLYSQRVFIPCLLINILSFCGTFTFHLLLSEGYLRLFLVVFCSCILHIFLGWRVGIDQMEKQIVVKLFEKLFGKIKLLKS